MNVSAIIVTRGDQDLTAILDSLPEEWEKVVWDNGAETVDLFNGPWKRKYGGGIVKESWPGRDLAVYGRYAAIEHASGDLIFTQDDDCVLPPESIDRLVQLVKAAPPEAVVCNMPERFREQPFYASREHALVGFGAVFPRSLPATTWGRLTAAVGDAGFPTDWAYEPSFLRTCDVPFTALNPRVLVDVPYENLPWAGGPDRMYRQPEHVAERTRMLALVRKVRDA